MPTTSLWVVAAEWPTGAPKTKLTLGTREPRGYSRERVPEHRVSFQANPMRYSMGFAKSLVALTEVLTAQMGVMRRSKKVSSFELYKLNPLLPHCGSIARKLVH